MTINTLKNHLQNLSRLLSDAGIEHSLIGGIAIGLRGYPRSTVDIDYLVNFKDLGKTRKILESQGFTCEIETGETMHFSGPCAVDLLFAQRPASLKMLKNATKIIDIPSPVTTTEDLIGLKIQAYINDPRRKWKDQADIAELLKRNREVNWTAVIQYAALFGEEETLLDMKKSLQ